MSRFGYLVFAFVLAIFSSSSGFAAASGDVRFRTVRLKAGGKIVHAEVAATDAQRERGLMYRKSLPENNGMLFVFDRPARSCMWMKNIEEMEPFTTDSHCSAGWIRYALEMNAGWFRKNGLKPGSRVEGLHK